MNTFPTKLYMSLMWEVTRKQVHRQVCFRFLHIFRFLQISSDFSDYVILLFFLSSKILAYLIFVFSHLFIYSRFIHDFLIPSWIFSFIFCKNFLSLIYIVIKIFPISCDSLSFISFFFRDLQISTILKIYYVFIFLHIVVFL